jgi:hypothetical protein
VRKLFLFTFIFRNSYFKSQYPHILFLNFCTFDRRHQITVIKSVPEISSSGHGNDRHFMNMRRRIKGGLYGERSAGEGKRLQIAPVTSVYPITLWFFYLVYIGLHVTFECIYPDPTRTVQLNCSTHPMLGAHAWFASVHAVHGSFIDDVNVKTKCRRAVSRWPISAAKRNPRFPTC